MANSSAYFAVGGFIGFAVVIGAYSIPGSVLCLICAFAIYLYGRQDSDEEPLFPHLAGLASNTPELEILEETEDELIVRGNERILILNRMKKSIAGIHSTLTTFDRVRYVQIKTCSGSPDGHQQGKYSVSFSLGAFSSITLGSTDSQVDASIMAAKLSTWTGKKVVA